MEDKVGIKETKEAITGLLELCLVLVSVLKDGVQVTDMAEILAMLTTNPEVKAKLEAAVTGASSIPAELSDVNLKEGLELTSAVIGYMPKLIAVLLKKR